MRKIFTNPIFTFILGALIFGSIGVVASGIFASNITYDNTTSGLKDSNDQDVTTVQGAIDALYTKSTTLKKLNTVTTVTPNKLLIGETAYNNLGELVTGNISTDCVAGSVPCDSNCTSNVGKKLVDFKPSRFFIHTQGTTAIVYYNISLSTSVWDIFPTNSYCGWNEYKAPNYNNWYVINDNGLWVKNFNSNNGTLDYVACK